MAAPQAQRRPSSRLGSRARRCVALLLVLAELLVPGRLSAATLVGVTFADRIEVAGQALVLNGLALRSATIFDVKVYIAALYLESPSSDANQILRSTARKRLVLEFLRAAGRAKIAEALRQGVRRNVRDSRALEGRLAQLSAAIPDLKKGNRVIFDIANGSVTVTLGRVKTVIAGDDFGRALLAVWLGSKPPQAAMKAHLLGK